jgi:hypothetical protein
MSEVRGCTCGMPTYEQIGYRVALEVPTWVIGHSTQFS